MTIPIIAPPTKCCSPAAAWLWTHEIAALALEGDRDAARWLPVALEHWLQSLSLETERAPSRARDIS